jgi:stage V sporulation protein D (sporulation-specific penicillin-binding protein)
MAIAQQRPQENSLVRKRMEVIFLLFLAVTVVIAGRLVWLQWFHSREFAAAVDGQTVRDQSILAPRGKILDRNGHPLANDELGKAIFVNPQVVRDPAHTARRLAALLGLTGLQETYVRELITRSQQPRIDPKTGQPKINTKTGKPIKIFDLQLRRGVERKLAQSVIAHSAEILGIDPKTVKERDMVRTGLRLEDSPRRLNPSERDGVQLIGQVSPDGAGLEAVEMQFDKLLRGTPGKQRVKMDMAKQPIPGTEIRIADPENGKDIRLTIDRTIQHFVEEELQKVWEAQTPDAATAIVLDVPTGQVLAMTNRPTYDPTQKGPVVDEARKNRAVTDLYEPGSTFKVITAAAALECGLPTSAHCSGSRRIGKYTVRCAHGNSHGSVDLTRMIQVSCNLGAGQLAERLGPSRIYQYLKKFGFLNPTGIEFPGEQKGRLPDPVKYPSRWPLIKTVNVGFGQGVVTTPIQLLSFYASVGNGGKYVPPRLVLDASGTPLPERPVRQIMKPETAQRLIQGMEMVVVKGTGTNAQLPYYRVAGKTGTAQLVRETGGYGGGYVSSFIGFFPVSQPKIAILVSVWNPKKQHYGGQVAAPAFREVARKTAQYLSIPPDAPDNTKDEPGRATATVGINPAAATD